MAIVYKTVNRSTCKMHALITMMRFNWDVKAVETKLKKKLNYYN